ncbi:MAG: hypothetical protein PHP22_00750 [Oscillospiraceae bacterium]|nr:hypothetical protein [Oscillospiraceae bacterium]
MRRLLGSRIHKRPFVVTSVVLGVFLAAGVLLVLYLGFFRQTAQTGQIRVSSEISGTEIRGIGLNIGTLSTPNMVSGSSFEKITNDQLFTVFEGSDDYVYLLQDGQSGRAYSDGSFVGGTVRIMSLDEQGQMVQKLLSDVVDFKESQFGMQTRMEGLIETDPDIRFIVSSVGNTLAFSRNGQYISDMTTASRRIFSLSAHAPIIAASEAGGRFNALAENWSVFTSTDGKNFNSYEPEVANEETPRAITSVDKVVIAAGEGGKILSYCDGEITTIDSKTKSDILAAAGDGKTALFVGADGAMVTTSNGLIIRSLNDTERPFSDRSVDWLCATYFNGWYVVVGNSGEIAFGEYNSGTGMFAFSGYQATAERGEIILPQSVTADPSGEILLLTEEGKTYILSDDRLSWKELYAPSTAPVKVFGRAADGRIILFRDGSFYSTRLLTRVEYGEHLTDTSIAAGDMCYLTHQTAVFDGMSRRSSDGLWLLYGNDAAAQISDDAPPSGGESSLKLYSEPKSNGTDTRFVSQILSKEGSQDLFEKTFYRVEVWLKQNGMNDSEVMVWLSGDFESVGTVFSEVGNNWRHYSALLVLPAEACGDEAGEVRLNIGYSGQGEIFMDKIYFGPDRFASESIPEEYMNTIRDIHPDYLRLSNISFGLPDTSSQTYYYPIGNEGGRNVTGMGYISQGCVSLEESLKMTRYAQSNPWLIIESSAGQEQIEHLIEYLCGSISEPYGKMRIENGTAVPWSTQFERIIFEIADSANLFKTDLQRGAFVDFIINVMESSPHYLDIKDRILFLDGMNYSGGSMLSTADFHSTSLYIEGLSDIDSVKPGLPMSGEAISTGYLDYYDLIPRILSRPRENVGEWIGSAYFRMLTEDNASDGQSRTNTTVTAAAYVDFLLHDLGHRTSVICVDLPGTESFYDFNRQTFAASERLGIRESGIVEDNVQALLSSVSALNDSISGSPISLYTISPASGDGSKSSSESDTLAEGTGAFAYIDGNSLCIIVTNTDDQPGQFRIETDYRIDRITVDHYSDTGEKIASTKRRNQTGRITLLPGQFIIIKGTVLE